MNIDNLKLGNQLEHKLRAYKILSANINAEDSVKNLVDIFYREILFSAGNDKDIAKKTELDIISLLKSMIDQGQALVQKQFDEL